MNIAAILIGLLIVAFFGIFMYGINKIGNLK